MACQMTGLASSHKSAMTSAKSIPIAARGPRPMPGHVGRRRLEPGRPVRYGAVDWRTAWWLEE